MVLVRLPCFTVSTPIKWRHHKANETFRSVVISIFAIIILSILGILFKANHPELVGSEEDPKDGEEVAATVFVAVMIYAVRSPGL